MRTLKFSLLSLLLCVTLIVPASAAPGRVPEVLSGPLSEFPTKGAGGDTRSLGATSPMFIENVGQFDSGARFQVRGGTGAMWLAEDAIWITLLEPAPDDGANLGRRRVASRAFQQEASRDAPRKGVNLRLSFVGANAQPRLEPFDQLQTKVSYFIGNDPEKWPTNVPVWGGVRYLDLYPGLDLELTTEASGWTWRLVGHSRDRLGTGALAVPQVSLRVEGADALSLHGGYLRASSPVGEVALPLLQVEGAGLRDRLSASPALDGDRLLNPFTPSTTRFEAYGGSSLQGTSDLLYSTFLGAGGSDGALGIAVDATGNAYVTGVTESPGFPTTPGAYDRSYNAGDDDVFVARLSAGGALLYSTFLGGGDREWGEGIAVDGAGDAWVTGQTYSSDFPTTQSAYHGSHNGYADAFVARLSPTGALLYSTFLGGVDWDGGYGIAVDGAGNAWVMGDTSSSDFPTTQGAYDRSHNGYADAFVARLSPGGALLYSTFLGGGSGELGEGIAVDGAGDAWLTGTTRSFDFPTTDGAYDGSHNGYEDAFVARLSPGGALIYSTFLGGGGDELGKGIAVDATGNAYVTGLTESPGFPTTPGAYDRSYNGGDYDVFVARLSPSGALLYSTFLGGDDGDASYSIAVDGAGDAWVTGVTHSSDFPTTQGAYDRSYDGGDYDAFVARLSAGGSLLYSTFLGGSAGDVGAPIALDGAGAAWVTGHTSSSDFPTTEGAYDRSHNGNWDVFVAKLAVGGGKPWLLMYYLAGDNDKRMHKAHEWFLSVLKGKTGQPGFNIAVMYDGLSEGDSRFYYVADNLTFVVKNEVNTGDPNTLAEFVNWARDQFPYTHSALIIDDHGNVDGAAYDASSSTFFFKDYLTMPDLKSAYGQIVAHGGKVDVLVMDACLMGTIESAYQARDFADYYVASEQLSWNPNHPYYLDRIAMDSTAESVAGAMALSYEQNQDARRYPYTISVARMSRLPDLAEKVSTFAEMIKLNTSIMQLIKLEIELPVQRFDSDGSYRMNVLDELIDLYDFARLLREKSDDAQMQAAAEAVMDAIRDDPLSSNRYIIYERHRSGNVPAHVDAGTPYWDLEHSHGVSGFFPSSSRSFYNQVNFDFAAGTDWSRVLEADRLPAQAAETIEWGPMLVEYVRFTNRDEPDDPNPPPLIAPLSTWTVYLPLVLSTCGGS